MLELTPCTAVAPTMLRAARQEVHWLRVSCDPGPEGRQARGDFLGNQTGLRADLRLSSADADDAGAAHPLFPRIRHHRSRSCNDHPLAPPISLPRQLR